MCNVYFKYGYCLVKTRFNFFFVCLAPVRLGLFIARTRSTLVSSCVFVFTGGKYECSPIIVLVFQLC